MSAKAPPPPIKPNAAARDGDDDDDDVTPTDNKAASTAAAGAGHPLEPKQVRVASADPAAAPAPEPEPSKPCCTKRCAWCFFAPWYYLFLFIFIVVGLALALSFICVHFAMRLVHFIFWGLAQMRNSVEDVLDVEKLQVAHEHEYKKDFEAWKQRQANKEAEKGRLAAARERKGQKRPANEESSSDEEPPRAEMRVCSGMCVAKSAVSCFGMSMNGTAYCFFVLAFMFGFASVSIFTAVFPTCTVRGVTYLGDFRKTYDLDLAGHNRPNTEPK